MQLPLPHMGEETMSNVKLPWRQYALAIVQHVTHKDHASNVHLCVFLTLFIVNGDYTHKTLRYIKACHQTCVCCLDLQFATLMAVTPQYFFRRGANPHLSNKSCIFRWMNYNVSANFYALDVFWKLIIYSSTDGPSRHILHGKYYVTSSFSGSLLRAPVMAVAVLSVTPSAQTAVYALRCHQFVRFEFMSWSWSQRGLLSRPPVCLYFLDRDVSCAAPGGRSARSCGHMTDTETAWLPCASWRDVSARRSARTATDSAGTGTCRAFLL